MTKKSNVNSLFEIVCRWYVFIFLNHYGWGKILGMQFYRKGNLPLEVAEQTLGSASGYDIAWTFMGYSQGYILFIGISQIIGAWLLLWNRTKLLGVTILIPIMVNIMVFDLIFLDVKDALVNATIYFLMLIYILFFNNRAVLQVIGAMTESFNNNTFTKGAKKWKEVAIILLIMAVIFGIDQSLVGLVRR